MPQHKDDVTVHNDDVRIAASSSLRVQIIARNIIQSSVTLTNTVDVAAANVVVPPAPPLAGTTLLNYCLNTTNAILERELINAVIRGGLAEPVGSMPRQKGRVILHYLRHHPGYLRGVAQGNRPAVPQQLAINMRNHLNWNPNPPAPPGPPIIPAPILAILQAQGLAP
jgi:hypothetical protein